MAKERLLPCQKRRYILLIEGFWLIWNFEGNATGPRTVHSQVFSYILQAKIAAISEVVSVLVQSIKEGEDVDLNDVKKQVFFWPEQQKSFPCVHQT